MREINVSQITDVVEKLCIEANQHLPEDVKCAIKNCRACEDWDIAQGVLDKIIENYEIADSQCVPICQDTGMACVFLEIGQDVHIVGGDLTEAVNEELAHHMRGGHRCRIERVTFLGHVAVYGQHTPLVAFPLTLIAKGEAHQTLCAVLQKTANAHSVPAVCYADRGVDE